CTPRALQCRAYVYTRPAHTAVARAVHHVLARGQAATALVHRCHVNPATSLRVASDLDITDETGVELHGVPGGAVIGVNYIQRAAPDVEVVIGYIHPTVDRAGQVVVPPH